MPALPGSKRGVCSTCGKPAYSDRAFRCDDHRGTPANAPVIEDEPDQGGLFGGDELRPTANGSATERAKGAFARLRGTSNKVNDGGDPPAPKPPSGGSTPSERRPKAAPRREPLADLLGLAWGGVGTALVRGPDVPVGRAMQAQSLVAGDILDRAVKGTVVDKVLQPIARRAEDTKALFALLGVPVLVGVLERNPAMAPVLSPLLYTAVEQWIVEMAPVMKKRQAQQAKVRKTLEEAFPELEPGVDPVAEIVNSFFAPPDGQEAEPEREPAMA